MMSLEEQPGFCIQDLSMSLTEVCVDTCILQANNNKTDLLTWTNEL